MKRVVPDTNILISALIFAGLPAKFLASASAGEFRLVTSPTLLDELDEILRGKFSKSATEADEVRARFELACDVVSTTNHISVIKEDPDDDRVLECAIAGRADYIVSGDRHLLNLGTFQGIAILTVRQFIDKLSPTA